MNVVPQQAATVLSKYNTLSVACPEVAQAVLKASIPICDDATPCPSARSNHLVEPIKQKPSVFLRLQPLGNRGNPDTVNTISQGAPRCLKQENAGSCIS